MLPNNPELSTPQGDLIYFKKDEAMEQRQLLPETTNSAHWNLKILSEHIVIGMFTA